MVATPSSEVAGYCMGTVVCIILEILNLRVKSAYSSIPIFSSSLSFYLNIFLLIFTLNKENNLNSNIKKHLPLLHLQENLVHILLHLILGLVP